jgi:hypothetical protein
LGYYSVSHLKFFILQTPKTAPLIAPPRIVAIALCLGKFDISSVFTSFYLKIWPLRANILTLKSLEIKIKAKRTFSTMYHGRGVSLGEISFM